MNKDELRKIYLAKRSALTESEHRELSHKISERFFLDVDLSFVKIIHIFIPIESKREPNTWLIIKRLQKSFSHIRIVIPRVTGDEMENIFFEGNHQLEKARWGMMEPKAGLLVHPKEIDLVLVPLLAFDRQGHRIGYGKGFYDRFLKLCRPDCIRIGVSLFGPETTITEKNHDDALLNGCITPDAYIIF